MKVAKIMADKIEGNVNAIGTEAKDFFVDLRSSFMYKMIFGKNRKKKINN